MQVDKIFMVHSKGWICSNEGSFVVESDVIKGPTGVRESISRQKIFSISKYFAHGQEPIKGTEVECMCALVTGNKLTFSAVVEFCTGGNCRLKVIGQTKNTGFDEIIKAIVSM